MPNIQLMAVDSTQPDVIIPIAPEKRIDFIRQREIAKYDIPGSSPEYQDMGEGESICRFSGVLYGYDDLVGGKLVTDNKEPNALEQAEMINVLKDLGEPLKMIYGNISATVIIRSFNYQYYRPDYVRYDIELIQVGYLEIKQENQVNSQQDKLKSKLKKNTNPLSKVTNLLKDINAFKNKFNHEVWKVQSMINNVIATKNAFVQQADSLRRISQRLFGTPHKWRSLARLNNMTGPNIPEGTRNLRIPASRGELLEFENLVNEYVVKKRPAIKAAYKGGGRGSKQ